MIEIINPKQNNSKWSTNESRFFPYYAGYSEQFAESILGKLKLSRDRIVLDPWSGSGTTSIASYKMGLSSIGIDLNPVMVLVAKASCVSKLDVSSLIPLAHSLVKFKKSEFYEQYHEDPLSNWFMPQSVVYLRAIEAEINKLLVKQSEYSDLTFSNNLNGVSSIAAFFYVVLFRVARRFVMDFVSTNPTWLKTPKNPELRKSIDAKSLKNLFIKEVELLCQKDFFIQSKPGDLINIKMGDAQNLEIESESIDAIVTSPPYCTRIDYAVATSLELALLRMSTERYKIFRRSLTGTPTVEKTVPAPELSWGETCNNFLESVKNHHSTASKTYYYKNHIQYYRALHRALSESARVCRSGSDLVFVVQSSYYKDIFNDLAQALKEMGVGLGLEIREKYDFPNLRSMSDINSNSKKYSKSRRGEESVLVFKKN